MVLVPMLRSRSIGTPESNRRGVTNLSHGGALIMRAGRLPEEGAPVVVVLQVSQEEIRFRAQVRQITDNDQPASFGIEFRESSQQIESKLIRLMEILYPGDEETEAED